MTKMSTNCIVCAEEFDAAALESIALSKINSTKFKVCKACLDKSDPSDDYNQARQIIQSYLRLASARSLFNEAQDILNSLDK